ncbi:O-antigen ligase family protein [Microbacterium sp. R86528]|uniref:O-antigen ligase family protein n=1 Tax=Microbacterium sp. R86528 TaxID=3093864 RepID=UPI0037C544F7
MSAKPRAASIGDFLASPGFARAYSLTVLGSVFASYLIEHTAGRVTYVTIIVGLCAIGIAVMVARRRELSILRLMPTTLLLFLGWALASTYWSTDGTQTFVNWVSLAAIALLAVVIGHIRDTLQTVRALGDVLRVLLSLSLATEVLSGVLLDTPFSFIGVQGNLAQLGPIQGIFGTRNMLGFVAVLAVITFLIEYRTQSVRVGLSLYSVILAGTLAAFSDSPTVFAIAIGTGAAVGALALVRHTRPEHRTAVQLSLGAAVVLALLIGYFARHPIIRFLGAGTDFSLRVDLWNLMVDLVRFHPVEGWGWFGPWAKTEFPFNAINVQLDETHATGLNAYFDVLLQLGWVGVILFAAFAGIALVRAWMVASERRSVVYAWTPLILVTLLIDSIFESFTLTGLGWLMLVLCAVRAGQSRSWRENLETETISLPPASSASL